MSFPNFNEGTNLVVLIWKTKLRSAIQALEKQDIIILIIFLHFYDSVLMCFSLFEVFKCTIQFNSVYWPIKGPQGATGKLYIDE